MSEAYLGGGVGVTFTGSGAGIAVTAQDAFADETVTVSREGAHALLNAAAQRRDVTVPAQAAWGAAEVQYRTSARGARLLLAGVGETAIVDVTFRRDLDEPLLTRALVQLLH
ncbi:hypothetical protein [Deinococcus soli (ex Cha et al. 2016)]|uniref:Uncharacterized protein n=2 Tax=Deinococcus soli (ex Cha et al. 2016) TaxID=1309411 RepID=A0ACC6KGM3_9DEIO|nr:hypothetical protein [Deinococcus soli (ex Cha et al. 2016)]MDR6218548.1 hypothetical protein [Deinococcus soli (ex Cha et al. 2016)]MDR6329288.1 hypothetical protein [Deinococcus soli (ex Cha et al. 2016)]MDR6751561.1 hypothetical protein [Deinococcus soli (ex Cha et al. 2016)]